MLPELDEELLDDVDELLDEDEEELVDEDELLDEALLLELEELLDGPAPLSPPHPTRSAQMASAPPVRLSNY